MFYAVFRYSSFWAAELCAFRLYRDPCSFSCHLSSFRGNLVDFRAVFVVRVSSGVIMQEIQLAEPMCFFMCFETCCFSLIHRVFMIPQYATNGQKFIWLNKETICCVFRFFIILSSLDCVISVLLWLLLFFMHLLSFLCILVIFMVDFVVWVSSVRVLLES